MRYRIAELRKAHGMTQIMLARRSGVSRATIAAMESNKNKHTTSATLLNLSEALNCSLDDLFFTETSNISDSHP